MSLYDDIILPEEPTQSEDVAKSQLDPFQAKNEEKAPSVPKSNLSFLKAQLESKKAQIQFKMKPTTVKAPSMLQTITPVSLHQDLTGPPPAKKPATPSLLKPKRVQPLKVDASTTFSIIPKALKEDKVILFNEIEVMDEYNPTAPTDYYAFKAKREAQFARERAAKEVAERLEREHAEEIAKRGKGAAIAPPTELMEHNVFEPEPQVEEFTPIPKKDVVKNIMSRMGYQKGLGLGKSKQGISTALQVKRVGGSIGMIVDESRDFTENLAAGVSEPPPVNITELLKSASKIVLVKNMVSSNDVDDDLKGEITEEMSKYGQIENVVIHLVQNAPETENVRIFVEFSNQAHAVKAVIDLNKRFFNGRVIRSSFYSVDNYESQQYEK